MKGQLNSEGQDSHANDEDPQNLTIDSSPHLYGAISVSVVAIQCLEQLTCLFTDQYLQEQPGVYPALWQDELGRLRVWAANIGVHQSGKGSLDVQLRDALHIKDQTLRLLERLRRTAEDLQEALQGSECKDDFGDDFSDSSNEDETELQSIYRAFRDTIDNLFQMSILIQRPAQCDRLLGTKTLKSTVFDPYAMSAMPYQGYMEPFTLMNMLSMQLEYYFSVDNMCKDMFLRRRMDSQGFVPLGVIASFKRVKSLTEDFELLRHISRQLRTVEYQTGKDGVDRLRPRERWAQWILPYDQREPSAQHEGAAPAAHPSKNDENIPFNTHGPNGSVPNGTGTRGSQSLSSTAPEFQPSMPQNEIANVGYPMDTRSYPAESSPRECSSHFPPWIDPEVNNSPAACGLDPNPTSPPSISSGRAAVDDDKTIHPPSAVHQHRNPAWKGKANKSYQKS
ncbi:hypothetical protein N7445_010424 [Penicillium cf. griseofulvum]|nr:hypothetical protein N7445_010424 [Penicillium cf. griseofulvum]